MREILLINPKMKGKKMEEKKKKRKKAKKNPSTRKIARSAATGFMGLNFKRAAQDMPVSLAGMFAAKFAAKRFGEANALESDAESWSWASYLKGAVGSVIAGAALNMWKAGAGQKALEGGLNLMAFKVIQNELVQKNDTAISWLGEGDRYLPGDMVENDQGAYVLGEDGGWMPIDERHRLPEVSGALEPIGPLGAERLEPVNYLGAEDDPFKKAFMR